MKTGLARSLLQHRHPLPGQRVHLQVSRPRLQLEPSDHGAAVEGVRRVLLQLRSLRQPDPLPGHGQQLGPRRLPEILGEEEEVGEVHRAAAVQVEAGIAAAEGLGEEEEVGEIGHAVAVEVRRGLGRGGEGYRLELSYRCDDSVGSQLLAQRQGGARQALGVGGVGGGQKGPRRRPGRQR